MIVASNFVSEYGGIALIDDIAVDYDACSAQDPNCPLVQCDLESGKSTPSSHLHSHDSNRKSP